jgi:hypothetical protein
MNIFKNIFYKPKQKTMKNKIICTLFFTLSLILINEANAQLPSEYPFRSKIDGNGSIYVTGSENNQIFTRKFFGSNSWHQPYSNPLGDGNDMGMDVVIDEDYNVYVAGYVYNSGRECDNIVLLKYDSDGTLVWDMVYEYHLDSRALALAIDGEQNIYLCGFITSENEDKNFITMKIDNSGYLQWEHVFDHEDYTGDDIATSILIDKYRIYVLGYSYQESYENDLLLLTYDMEGILLEDELFNYEGDEKPTSFIIAEESASPVVKSTLASGGYLDLVINGNPFRNYFTYYFGGGVSNEYIWTSQFGSQSDNHVSTSVAKNGNGDIIVTGYTYNGNNQYDFGTLKLDKNSGNTIWTKYYDQKNSYNESGDDKASSVAIDSRGSIYVTGYSEHSTQQYVTVKYIERDPVIEPVQDWVQGFAPDFRKAPIDNPQYASELHVDHEDNIILFAMNWNNDEAQYDVVKYNQEGNVIYMLGEGSSSFSSAPGMINSSVTGMPEGITIFENYPNPFNPVTTIRYNLLQSGNIEIKLYNSLGQLVKNIFSGYQSEGYKEQVVDAASLSSGMYYYIVKGNGFNEVRKITLVK